MEMVLSSNFSELTFGETLSIEGGVNWGQALEGAAILGGTLLAVASAPVSVPALVIGFAGASGAAWAGYKVGSSF
ncbi:hypothetical protein [Paenibacillus sp. Z3-2]